jgi:hypothetical protein
VVQHDLQWIYISGLLQCDFCTAGLLFAYPRKSGSLGFRKTTLVHATIYIPNLFARQKLAINTNHNIASYINNLISCLEMTTQLSIIDGEGSKGTPTYNIWKLMKRHVYVSWPSPTGAKILLVSGLVTPCPEMAKAEHPPSHISVARSGERITTVGSKVR